MGCAASTAPSIPPDAAQFGWSIRSHTSPGPPPESAKPAQALDAGQLAALTQGDAAASRTAAGLSVLRGFASPRHLDDPRVEAGQCVHQAALGRHHIVDVLVGHRDLVEAGGQELDATFPEDPLGVGP